MLINAETANHIIDTAVTAVAERPDTFVDVLDRLPAAIYVTDKDGTITYFNHECVKLAGRTPEVGRDKWCVSWKLYTSGGEPLRHDQCPMAVAIREKRQVRDVCAVAERPDGTRISFIPFPTPMFNRDGDLVGAVNLLVETSRNNKSRYLSDQAEKCRHLAQETADGAAADVLHLMAVKYDEHALKLVRQDPL